MGRTICISIVIVCLELVVTYAGDYPSFMDEDDIRIHGLGRNPYNPNPHHKIHHEAPTVTGKYTGHPNGYRLDPYGNFEHPNNIPANGLSRHRIPLNRNVQRGAPVDQNIIDMVAEAQLESPFPEDDGIPDPNDARELEILPERLSKAKKWGEFRSLLAEERAQFEPGEVMQNWEEDAHKWAGYSHHLLARAAHDQEKMVARQATEDPKGSPNIGMNPYWSDDTIAPKPPPDKVSDTWFLNMRRQLFNPPDRDEGTFDNIQGPLDHAMPPMFSQGRGQQDYDYPEYGKSMPMPRYGKPVGRSRDADYPNPGQGSDRLAGLDYGTFKNGDLERYMPPYPRDDTGPGPDGPMPREITRIKRGRKPGPGSEKDYPDGFKPSIAGNGPDSFTNYMDPGPDPAFTGGNYPQSKKVMSGGTRPRMGNIPQPRSVPMPGEEVKKPEHFALRMGMGKLPGPGSEKEFPSGYSPGSMMPGKSFSHGGSPGQFGPHVGPRPGNRGYPPGQRIQEGSAPEDEQMPGRPPKQFNQGFNRPNMKRRPGPGEGPPDYGRFHPPREMSGMGQQGFPPGGGASGSPAQHQAILDKQFPPRPGGPDMKPGGRPPRKAPGQGPYAKKGPPGNSPSSVLLAMAQKKLADLENGVKNSTAEKQTTTTLRPLTKEEILKNLQQYDDFRAPVRWVTFNSPDTQDGLARVTDPKTHQNQQYFIEGELYVPIIDESMSRLGWTTEDIKDLTTTESVARNDEAALKVVMKSLNLTLADQSDWLVYETVMGSRVMHEKECDGENCQSRCSRLGCDTVCRGDTCASGCVGANCNTLCTGPGCHSMCIGDHCTAKCDGISCDVRCYGKECETECKSFSCMKTTNGVFRASNSTWNNIYPQYGMDYGPQNHMRQAPQDYDENYYEN